MDAEESVCRSKDIKFMNQNFLYFIKISLAKTIIFFLFFFLMPHTHAILVTGHS